MPKYVEIRCQCGVNYQTDRAHSMCPGCYKKHHTPGLGGLGAAIGSFFRAFSFLNEPEFVEQQKKIQESVKDYERSLKAFCKHRPTHRKCKDKKFD
jgi:hypothetical protein